MSNAAQKEDCCHTPQVDGSGSLRDLLHHTAPPKPSAKPFIISLVLASISMFASMRPEVTHLWAGISATTAGIVVFVFGLHFFKAIPLIFRSANMNTLIGLSIVAAFGLSFWNWSQGNLQYLYFDSAAFVAGFVLLGQFLESAIHQKMQSHIGDLSGFLPRQALRIDDSGERRVDLESLSKGDRVRVLVGERVPVDCVLLDEGATFDESIVSGESKPVTRRAGEAVVQGALNVGQPVLLQVSRAAENSLYVLLLKQVRETLAQKSDLQQRVDQIARWFVPIVVLISAAAAVFWKRYDPQSDLFVMTSVSVLVIACPCAIGLATPTALFVGVIRAARQGILMKSLDAVDRVRDITMIAFDKTGTLTEGRPSVRRILSIENISHTQVIQWALSAEQNSEHPYAVAIRNRAMADKQLPLEAKDLQIVAGKGVAATIRQGNAIQKVCVGNLVWLYENGYEPTQTPAQLAWEAEGTDETALWVGVDQKVQGIIFVADELRPQASAAVADLQEQGFEVGMITGDSDTVARSFAKRLKLKFFHAGVLPQEKASLVKRLHEPKKKGLDYVTHRVAFIGDGVNDAPALAEAHLGIAMGSGASLSQSAADLILLNNDISQIPRLLRILRRTRSLITQNLALSFVYNTLTIPVAAGALYLWKGVLLNPHGAAVLMALSSLSVLGNSLRALRIRD
jgi:heavy metal translocating P-type ATPase